MNQGSIHLFARTVRSLRTSPKSIPDLVAEIDSNHHTVRRHIKELAALDLVRPIRGESGAGRTPQAWEWVG